MLPIEPLAGMWSAWHGFAQAFEESFRSRRALDNL